MKVAGTLTLILATALNAEAAGTAEKKLARAEVQIAKGNALMASAQNVKGEGKRLRLMRRAKQYFIWARTGTRNALKKADGSVAADLRKAENRARQAQVAVLNREAGYYHTRGATSLARRRNAEALKLAPKNKRALNLAAAMKKAKKPSASDRRAARDPLSKKRYDKRRGTQIDPRNPSGAPSAPSPAVKQPARAAGATRR